MNLIKEAQSAFDFATYCPLLYKAVADNDSTIPGFSYEEIIKISFISHHHRVHLVDFLLTKLNHLGWSGKQKVMKILLQLSHRGHHEVRVLIRQRDGELRKAASKGGPPDPVLANTPQLFFNSSVQELLSYIFDPAIMKADEEMNRKGESHEAEQRVSMGGYGASAATKGKYDGFGNTTSTKDDGLVQQVRTMVGKVVVSESQQKEVLEGLLKSDKGSYEPFTLHIQPPLPTVPSKHLHTKASSAAPPSISTIISPRAKAHVAGRVGGGWQSDDDEEPPKTLKELVGAARDDLPPHQPPDSEGFVDSLLRRHPSWPVELNTFVDACRDAATRNPFHVLADVAEFVRVALDAAKTRKEVTTRVTPKAEGVTVATPKAERVAEVSPIVEGVTEVAPKGWFFSKNKQQSASKSKLEHDPGKEHDLKDIHEKEHHAKDIILEKERDSKDIPGKKFDLERDFGKDHFQQRNLEHGLLVVLLFLEWSVNEDVLSVAMVQSSIDPLLSQVHDAAFLPDSARLKARKISLTIRALLAYS